MHDNYANDQQTMVPFSRTASPPRRTELSAPGAAEAPVPLSAPTSLGTNLLGGVAGARLGVSNGITLHYLVDLLLWTHPNLVQRCPDGLLLIPGSQRL